MALSTEINILSLCSGIGGLDRGVHAALRSMGFSPRTVCYVEIEAYAAAVLGARMEDGSLDAAPIWSNLKTFPSAMFSGRVDMVIGGYPCQPFSVAGKRKGAEDPRHLWPHIRTIIEATRPAICFFENVRGHLKLGYETVHRELEELGFAVEPGIFSAAEVGATHRRERLFILAYSPRHGGNGSEWEAGSGRGVCKTGDAMADAEHSIGRTEHEIDRESHGRDRLGWGGGIVGNASGTGPQGCERCCPFGERDRSEAHGSACEPGGAWLPQFPPGPGDQSGWERVLAVRPDLAPALSIEEEDRIGVNKIAFARRLPASETAVESPLRRVVNGIPNRVDQLRGLGNAVVSEAAEHALRCLWREAI